MTRHVCPWCGGRWWDVLTCSSSRLVVVAVYGEDLPAGEYAELADELPGRCWDCGVALGAPHHVGCGVAACLDCGDYAQRMCCGCDEQPGPSVRPLR